MEKRTRIHIEIREETVNGLDERTDTHSLSLPLDGIESMLEHSIRLIVCAYDVASSQFHAIHPLSPSLPPSPPNDVLLCVCVAIETGVLFIHFAPVRSVALVVRLPRTSFIQIVLSPHRSENIFSRCKSFIAFEWQIHIFFAL